MEDLKNKDLTLNESDVIKEKQSDNTTTTEKKEGDMKSLITKVDHRVKTKVKVIFVKLGCY
jgi:hypothetical protein